MANNLFRFLDGILCLSVKLELEYKQKVKKLAEENSVQFLSNLEKEAMQQGMQQGMQEEGALLLKSLLKEKFKETPSEYLQKIEKADVRMLNIWAINFVHAQNIEDVFKTRH